MQPDWVLYRTQKGEECLLSHEREISANLRRALLVVNGKSTVADLLKTVFWVNDCSATLKELLDIGLIHHEASAVQGGAGQGQDAGTPIKMQLVAIAKELLGDEAERVIRKIDEAETTPAALEQMLVACKKLIKLTISEEKAEVFLLRGRAVIDKS